MPISAEHLDQLRGIVGPQGYLDQPADIEPYTIDHRHLYHGATPLVLRPERRRLASRSVAVAHA